MEGMLHSHRRNIVSNKALWRAAEEIGIPQFVLSKIFSSKYWYPANFTVRASFNPVSDDNMEPDSDTEKDGNVPVLRFKRHKEQCVHQLGDKVGITLESHNTVSFFTANSSDISGYNGSHHRCSVSIPGT
jgi:hypothetical protein